MHISGSATHIMAHISLHDIYIPIAFSKQRTETDNSELKQRKYRISAIPIVPRTPIFTILDQTYPGGGEGMVEVGRRVVTWSGYPSSPWTQPLCSIDSMVQAVYQYCARRSKIPPVTLNDYKFLVTCCISTL